MKLPDWRMVTAMLSNPLASLDLGLGDTLSQQQKTETEEEKRKKRLGLSVLGNDPLQYGRTGVASIDLGVSGAGIR